MNGGGGAHPAHASAQANGAAHGGAVDVEPATARRGRLTCEDFHRISRALADSQRFALLQKLSGSRETACQELVECFPVTQATISHHLKELHAAGLITCRRDGKCVHLRADRERLRAYQRELASRLGTPRRRRAVAKD